MADGRHIANRKIAISRQKVIQFWWNLVHISRFGTRWHWQSRDQMWIFKIQDGGWPPY